MNDVDLLDLPSELTLAVVYVDEHLIGLEAIVRAGYWCGRVKNYTVSNHIADFALALIRFTDGTSIEAKFVAGSDTGAGLIALRFYRVDRSGHIACHVRLDTGGLPEDHRPEQVFRFLIEVQTETWAVIQFARQLDEVARTLEGRASLRLCPFSGPS